MIFPLNPTIRRDDRLTDNEFYAFCQANPDLRLERDENGQIYIEMPTGSRTSIRNLDLAAEVYLWNRQHKAGIVTESNGGFTLPDTSVRVPYVAWVSNERWNALSEIEKDNFAQVCPDFVIELMSDVSEKYTLPAKMEKYLQNGVRLGWVIDPFSQQTTIYRPERDPEVVNFADILDGEIVLPGFELILSDLL
ncbi:Uma2 family endonuclease [Spirosoma sp. KCTC 42546]|uniref:Uma2 family endonuclease n=1 Tax=Spirosoma sp. KCTC 42546 TaxID=2520506 RepID=UPI00115A998D|nr:Uma2 family endonuclease [Spirosoma sp. KCTC 42546]QDK82129.1 Uma2 family endonuclease [Spirosoma sp. KCTC 42546]